MPRTIDLGCHGAFDADMPSHLRDLCFDLHDAICLVDQYYVEAAMPEVDGNWDLAVTSTEGDAETDTTHLQVLAATLGAAAWATKLTVSAQTGVPILLVRRA